MDLFKRRRFGRRRQRVGMLAALALLLSGCVMLTQSPPPTIAPIVQPVATIAGGGEQFDLSINLPSTNAVLPARDPDIAALVDAVSEQQLIAYVQQLTDFGTRNSFSETQSETFGIGAARRWIFSEFERVGNGRLEVRYEDFPLQYQSSPNTTQRNVVAVLPGASDHPGVIVIGAHYDSRPDDPIDGVTIAPAANDNGSGTATLIELARLLSSRTWNQTIIFVAFAAEEQGTYGSRYFVTNSILQGRQIDLAISMDGVGGRPGIPQSVRMFAPNMETSPAGQVARYVKYIADLYVPQFPVEMINDLDRVGRYGDHREFINAGIGAVRLIESVEDPTLLNCPCDTWEKIDYGYVANVTRVALATVANWAGGPRPVPRPSIVGVVEPGTYLVTWPLDPQAASYAVVFRPLEQIQFPVFRLIPAAEAGQVTFSGLEPNRTYAVSVAAVGPGGRLGGFSPEVIVP